MIPRLAAIGLALSGLLAAENQRFQVAKTEHLNFVPNGSVRLENSIGELRIEGWDQPDVEITTTKSRYASPKGEDIGRKLEKIRVSAERRGDEIVVTTTFPKYRTMPPPLPWRSVADFDLEYLIHVPRQTRLVVHHNSGEVHIADLWNDIDVQANGGLIALSLPQQAQYDIDAKSDVGRVVTDFPGRARHRPWPLGHQLLQNTQSPAPKLHLRIGYGDIEILRINQPATPSPRGQ